MQDSPQFRVRARAPDAITFRAGAVVAPWLAATVLAAGLFISNVAAGQTAAAAEPLSLKSALREAENRSQALTALDAGRQAALEMAVAAAQPPDPELRLSVENLPVGGADRFSFSGSAMTMRAAGVMQMLVREDKRRARSARFEREGDVALAMRTMQLFELRRQTTLSWFDRHHQRQMAELLARQRAAAEMQVEAAELAYRVGHDTQEAVFAARAAVARIDDQILDARAREAGANVMLARWIGELAAAPTAGMPSIRHSRFVEQPPTQWLERRHPDLAVLARKLDAAVAETEVARQEKRADWSVSLMYGHRGSGSPDTVSLGVSIPLAWNAPDRQDRAVAAKLAMEAQVRAEREERARAHAARIANWRAEWQSRLARLDHFDKHLIPLAGARANAALAAYRGGRGALATVLDAQRMEVDVRIERLKIEMEAAVFWTELEYLDTGEERSAAEAGAAGRTMATEDAQ